MQMHNTRFACQILSRFIQFHNVLLTVTSITEFYKIHTVWYGILEIDYMTAVLRRKTTVPGSLILTEYLKYKNTYWFA